MAKQSGYLQRREAELDATFNAGAALDCRNPEADVCQEHMDRVLAEIIRNRMILIRFPERYPHVKKIKYGR